MHLARHVALAWLLAAVLVPCATADTAPAPGTIYFSSNLSLTATREGTTPDALRLVTYDAGSGARRDVAPGSPGDSVAFDSVSPDGRMLAFIDQNALWVSGVDGSNAHGIVDASSTESFYDESFDPVAWSPDGTRIAFSVVDFSTCLHEYYKCASWNVVVADLSGRRLASLDSAREPLWTPDGRVVAQSGHFSDPDIITTVVWNPTTGKSVDLYRHLKRGNCWRASTWSHGGSRVAMAYGCTARTSATVVLRGSDLTPLWRVPGGSAAWAPDGRTLLTVSHRRVELWDGHARLLRSIPGDTATWSPDGERLAVTRGHELIVVSRSFSTLWHVTGALDAWAPDGKQLLFERLPARSVWLANAANGVARRLAAGRAEEAIWSHDGARLAFIGSTTSQGYTLCVADWKRGVARVLARFASDEHVYLDAWSGDRTVVAIRQLDEPYEMQVLAVRPDGTGLRAVTHDPVDHQGPAASPDGKTVLYWRDMLFKHPHANGPWVFALDVATGKTRVLLGDASSFAFLPAWSPDGRSIVYERIVVGTPTTPPKDDIYIADADGANPRPVTTDGHAYSPAWSPDGQSVAYGDAGNIVVARADGSDAHTVLSSSYGNPAWSPDGGSLALASDAGLVILDLQSGAVRQLVAGSIRHPSWSPDGGSIVYAAYDTPGGGPRVEIVDVATGEHRLLAPAAWRTADPRWSVRSGS